MLVLTRKTGEKIFIGPGITITALEVRGNKVRIGIDAPQDVPVLRAELGAFARLALSHPLSPAHGKMPVHAASKIVAIP